MDAVAVTEEVSLPAVPANIPKLSPLVVSKPISPPSAGKISAASTLNRKMTEIACATSSSSASITGAVAATALPPQILDPTPISVASFPGTRSIFCSSHAIIRLVAIVEQMMGSDCAPVSSTTLRFRPKPSRITAYCSTFLDVNAIPLRICSRAGRKRISAIPSRIPKTGAPTTGTAFPRSQHGRARAKHSRIPIPFFLINCISNPPAHRKL